MVRVEIWAKTKHSGQILAVGNWKGAHAKAELFSLSTTNWEVVPDYPAEYINRQAIVHVENAFFVFGGYTEVGQTDSIGKVTLLLEVLNQHVAEMVTQFS